jgi:hypothetical protein
MGARTAEDVRAPDQREQHEASFLGVAVARAARV